MNMCQVLGLVPALSGRSKVDCVHTAFCSVTFQPLGPPVRQCLLSEGPLCKESSLAPLLLENQRRENSTFAEGLGLTLTSSDLGQGQPWLSPG